MSNTELASVIINNYNYGRFLRNAIDSALDQTWPNAEVIVVDDGSTDGSRGIIASYGNRIVPVFKQNGGQNSALNAGFSVSRGKVVLFLDSDDALIATAAEAAIRALSEPNTAKAHWPLAEWDECSRPTGRVFREDLPEGNMRNQVRQNGPDAVDCLPSGNAYARKFLETVFPLPDVWGRVDPRAPDQETRWLARPGPDLYLSTMAALYGSIKRVSQPQAYYRFHGQNGYQSLNFEGKLKHNLALFEYVSKAAGEYCEKLGIKADRERWKTMSWANRIHQSIGDIIALVPSGASFILVDEDRWSTDPFLAGRKRIPFLEREGQYWGNPRDDETAIWELERLRSAGATFIIFVWSAFWWFAYYLRLYTHLCTEYRCVLENDRILVFDLRKGISQ